jgi:hypothetical protein
MNFVNFLIKEELNKAKDVIFQRLDQIAHEKLVENFNPNILRVGRVQKIRRRIRRNAKGKIVVQRNVRRSAIRGYQVSGNTVKRISAVDRIRRTRALKLAWKTTRKAKLKRSLLKRKLSLQRRRAMGLR